MSWPASPQRALNQIEKTLADDHPSLGPLFAIFTGLARRDAMPLTERVVHRPWRLRRERRMCPTGDPRRAGHGHGGVVHTQPDPARRQMCPGVAFSVAARMQSVPTGRQLACPIQQSKPSKTSPARAGTTP
jgi:hypothetical protein